MNRAPAKLVFVTIGSKGRQRSFLCHARLNDKGKYEISQAAFDDIVGRYNLRRGQTFSMG